MSFLPFRLQILMMPLLGSGLFCSIGGAGPTGNFLLTELAEPLLTESGDYLNWEA